MTLLSYRHRHARQEAEADLHVLRRAVDACTNPIAIVRADEPDYLIEYVNPAFERVTGLTTLGFKGSGVPSLCQPGLSTAT